ncbi:MAG: hypothetical protein J3K34DRAFT_413952 [Monoraphidium minutum]|nr:MAG: hypothetical protein J3K34DRAFT_413952 [Monoraphidium minutum]
MSLMRKPAAAAAGWVSSPRRSQPALGAEARGAQRPSAPGRPCAAARPVMRARRTWRPRSSRHRRTCRPGVAFKQGAAGRRAGRQQTARLTGQHPRAAARHACHMACASPPPKHLAGTAPAAAACGRAAGGPRGRLPPGAPGLEYRAARPTCDGFHGRRGVPQCGRACEQRGFLRRSVAPPVREVPEAQCISLYGDAFQWRREASAGPACAGRADPA